MLKKFFPFSWQHNATYVGLMVLVGVLIHDANLVVQGIIFAILITAHVLETVRYHQGAKVVVIRPLIKSTK
jgi:hypothetical protein